MKTLKDTSAQAAYPIEYRGYLIYANLKSVDKMNPVSGHKWTEMKDACGFLVQGPGANRSGREVYGSVLAAQKEIDYLIKFPSPVASEKKPACGRRP